MRFPWLEISELAMFYFLREKDPYTFHKIMNALYYFNYNVGQIRQII